MRRENEMELKLARAYVPMQIYMRRFSPMEGLRQGTIFPELVSPFEPRQYLGGDPGGK